MKITLTIRLCCLWLFRKMNTVHKFSSSSDFFRYCLDVLKRWILLSTLWNDLRVSSDSLDDCGGVFSGCQYPKKQFCYWKFHCRNGLCAAPSIKGWSLLLQPLNLGWHGCLLLPWKWQNDSLGAKPSESLDTSFSLLGPYFHYENKPVLGSWRMRDHMEQSWVNLLVPADCPPGGG